MNCGRHNGHKMLSTLSKIVRFISEGPENNSYNLKEMLMVQFVAYR